MRVNEWTSVLYLASCLQVAGVDAAFRAAHDPPLYDSKLSDQETLAGLCPDYTNYARHKQYVLFKSLLGRSNAHVVVANP